MTTSARFRTAYAKHREAEGRGSRGVAELLALPYLRTGPLARQWAVRARSYECLLRAVVAPLRRARAPQPLNVLDLGAGNGWLCYRLALQGHRCVALDWRRDAVDGLGAGAAYGAHLAPALSRVAASFDALPVKRAFDLVVFNAAIHYTSSLDGTIGEAVRATLPGGRLVILDSPFYGRAVDGERMVAEKRETARREWGDRAADLLALRMIEYLTADRLAAASAPFHLSWRRHRVRYPLWYELRPLAARALGRRPPSRFDVWETVVR
ncbi:MAG: SAM-dependent methyltransferase [Gemmatimonadetes bacterium]|nr:MAG: SAM-dependent methyltransferase [Gemmatimonadota bacterium]PYP33996.1 MAG: SAM-dependent methyltransferase [Gemmatimonadota bacterium]